VDPESAPHLEAGRRYQFVVRALNLCQATDPDLACYSNFSPPAVFAVRAPRPPLAPPPVLREERGTGVGLLGTWGDGAITVSWLRPIDNGGEVTHYRVFMEAPDGNVTQSPLLNASEVYSVDQAATYNPAVGHDRFHRYTAAGLDEGEVYVFQVAAVNARGRSQRSRRHPLRQQPRRQPPRCRRRSQRGAGGDHFGERRHAQRSPSPFRWTAPAPHHSPSTPPPPK
jgi:hypothetical protein